MKNNIENTSQIVKNPNSKSLNRNSVLENQNDFQHSEEQSSSRTSLNSHNIRDSQYTDFSHNKKSKNLQLVKSASQISHYNRKFPHNKNSKKSLRDFSQYKKGLAEIDGLILIIFTVIITILILLIVLQNNTKQQELVLIQMDVMKTKNIFSLFNNSLDATWSTSVMQALFAGAENGFDIGAFNAENPKEGYWYRFLPTENTSIKLPSEIALDTALAASLGYDKLRCNRNIAGISEKYNPLLCLPQNVNVQNFLNRSMKSTWFSLSEQSPYEVLPDGPRISITKVSDPTKNDLNITGLQFWPAYDRVIYMVATNVMVNGINAVIKTYATGNGDIPTVLSRMIKIGWLAVGMATQLRYEIAVKKNPEYYFYPEGNVNPDYGYIESSVDDFFREKANEINNDIITNPFGASILGPNEHMSVIVKPEINFKVPASHGDGHGLDEGGGLLLHYDALVRVEEGKIKLISGGPSGISPDCTLSFASSYTRYSAMIDRAVSDLAGYVESPQALVAAVITQESSWISDAKSRCGAVGLMQLMPDTARGLGLDVPNYAKICDENCVGVYSDCSYAFECNDITPEKCNLGDARFDAVENIRGGVKYLSDNIRVCKNVAGALSKYYTGSCTSSAAASYVNNVMDYYQKWKACIMTSVSSNLVWPAGNPYDIITSSGCFGNPREGYPHTGVDIGVAEGTDVYAALGGKVFDAISGCVSGNLNCNGGAGNYVVIEHTAGKTFYTRYLHLQTISIRKGDYVSAGDKIGTVGNTGHSFGAHLHFETRIDSGSDPEHSFNPCFLFSCGDICKQAPMMGSAVSPYDLPVVEKTLSQKQVYEMAGKNQDGSYKCDDANKGKYGCDTVFGGVGGIAGVYKLVVCTPPDFENVPNSLGIFSNCQKSDCSDCFARLILGEIQTVDDYSAFLFAKNGQYWQVSLKKDSFCEERDRPDRGNVNLGYSLGVENPGMYVYSAYDGDVIFISEGWEGCGGAVWVRTGKRIISYGHIKPRADLTNSQKNPRYQNSGNLITPVPVKKGDKLGIVFYDQHCAENKITESQLDIKVFEDSFKEESDKKNPCGTTMQCSGFSCPTGECTFQKFAVQGDMYRWWCAVHEKWEGTFGNFYEVFEATEGKHWRYDEQRNEFIKSNIGLRFRMEDWFAVLNCQGNDDKKFSWMTSGDMICKDNKLYTCNREITGIGNGKIAKDGCLKPTSLIDPLCSGGYKCITSSMQDSYKTRFCKRIDSDGKWDAGDSVDSAEGAPDDDVAMFCCENWPASVTTPANKGRAVWLANKGFCDYDNYCSNIELGWGYGDPCAASCDCCRITPVCNNDCSSVCGV